MRCDRIVGIAFSIVALSAGAAQPLKQYDIAANPIPTLPNASGANFDRNGGVVQFREAQEYEAAGVKRKPPTETTSQELAFQDFIFRNYGRWLPVYGLDSFAFEDQGFDSPVSTSPADAYEIGSGDEIRVQLTGPVELNGTFVVDNTGFISIPHVGPVLVAGTRRSGLQALIQKAVARYYTGFSLHASTGKLRSISVLVVGHAMRPGAYRVPASSSLLNVLYAANGTSPTGSLRAVRLMRDGRLVSQLDFYDLIAKGLSQGDVQLRNGDVVHIPPANARVALLGASNVQAIFEMSPQGTSLAELLQLAGGAAASSRVERVIVDRVDRQRPESPRHILTVNLRSEGADFMLEDGDVVSLQEMGQRFGNMVVARGSIYQAIRRPWVAGMRVSSLIPGRQALYSPETARARNDLARGEAGSRKAANRELLKGGKLNDVSQDLTEQQQQSIVPAENIQWNVASIERLNQTTGQVELLHFNLGRALDNPNGPDDLELQSGDQIVIYSDKSLNLPEEYRVRYVKVEGEVLGAGMYQLKQGETLKQLLIRAGGPTSRAYLFGLRLTRVSQIAVQKEQLRKAAQLLDDLVYQQSLALMNSSNSADQRSFNESLTSEVRSRADQLRRQTPDGRLSILMAPDAAINDLPDVPLDDGDVVYLPARPTQLSVYGAVNNPLTITYDAKRDLSSYVSSAQPKRNADLSALFVIRANGMAERVSRGMFSSGATQALPGDAIFVPEEPVRASLTSAWLNGLKDWSQVLVQMLIGAKVAKDL